MIQRITKPLVLWLLALTVTVVGLNCAAGVPLDGDVDNDPGNGSTVDPGDDDNDDDAPADDDGPVSGRYDPAQPLNLQADDLSLSIPPGASTVAFDLTIQAADDAGIAAPPGAARLAGGVFEPAAQQLQTPARATPTLDAPTLATSLPVLRLEGTSWVGTGATALVAADGLSATFDLMEFGTIGVPDGMALPVAGDAIGTLLSVPSTGVFTSTAISTETGSLLFSDSDFGDSFEISILDEADGQGVLLPKSLNLSAIAVSRNANFVIAEVGGPGSSFQDGEIFSLGETAVGVMIMSLSGSTVNVAIYVATPNRIIVGTFTGDTF